MKHRYFYNHDKNQQRRLGPKLTDNHRFAERLQPMKLALASHLFSNTVAASMSVCITVKIIQLDAKNTAEFTEKINDLFDSLNDTSINALKGKPCHRVISDSSPHLKFWMNLMIEIQTWHFLANSKVINPSTEILNKNV